MVAGSLRERSIVSAKSRMLVSGVRSSWLTLETKSACSSLRFASRRRNTSTSTMPVTTTEHERHREDAEEDVEDAPQEHAGRSRRARGAPSG